MFKRIYNDREIDFENGQDVLTMSSQSEQIEYRLRVFRNRYIGHKRRMIYQIINSLEKSKIKYESVLDAFCGGGFISMTMKLLNKKVICNDILKSSWLNALAFVCNTNIELSKREKEFLINNNSHSEPLPLFLEYKNKFSHREIELLSNYRKNINILFNEMCIKKSLSFAYINNYIMEKCFVGGRLNNGEVLADYDLRINHQVNRGRELNLSDIRWIKPIYPEDKNEHEAYQMDVISLLDYLKEIDKNIDLFYIDPPYGGEQSDYSTMYNFFERYVEDETDVPFRSEEENNRFINKNTYEKNFRDLLDSSQWVPIWAISYNDSSWKSIDKICDIIKDYRKNIKVYDFEYFYRHRSDRTKKNRGKEFLIIVE